jgi:protein arginine N-methyltransferase 1
MHSTEVITPERVGLIVCETLGNYAFEENIIETLNDARARFLKPGGRIIPAGVRQYLCPVVTERFHRELSAWDSVGYGLDLGPAKAMSLNNIYVRTFKPADLFNEGASARLWDSLTFDRTNKTTRTGEASWDLAEPATVYGLALWWVADLAEGVALSTSPLESATHWEQLYLPVLVPLDLAAGHTLHVRVRSTSAYAQGTNVAWTLSVKDAAGRQRGHQSLDLEKGFLP